MTPFAWLLGLVLPACGAEGAAGLPVPGVMDMTAIVRPSTPNVFLAGPAGMKPQPDLPVPPIDGPADAWFQTASRVFKAQPRVYEAAVFPKQRQIHFVARTAMMNFPDLVTVEIDPAGPDHSTITIWSRSVYGQSDLGVNRKRVETWLAALREERQ